MSRTLRKEALLLTAAGVIAGLTACAQPPAPPAAAATASPGATATAMPGGTPSASPQAVTTVSPTATAKPEPTPGRCDKGSLLAIWAHYDDGLLFGHTRLLEALQGGKCVTIAYLSAGDAGRGVQYSEDREVGIRAAYNVLRGYSGQWNDSADVLDTGVTVQEWTPVDEPQLKLLSFRLVDGNTDGSGFQSDGFESLAKLADGAIPTISDIDGPEKLTKDDITHSLAEIITDAKPDAILTLVPREFAQLAARDHSDHSTTASFARAAWKSMGIEPSAVTYAIGYQVSSDPVNIRGEALAQKVASFSAYAVKDPVIVSCVDLNSCLALASFGGWLQREYYRDAATLEPR